MMDKRDKLLGFIDYIFIYLLIFMSSGYQINAIAGTKILLSFIGVVVLMLLIKGSRIHFKKTYIILFILIMINILLTIIISGDKLEQFVITVVMFATAFFSASYFEIHEFIKKYVNVMCFISVFSLGLFALWYILPNVVMLLPPIYNVHGAKAYDAIFSSIAAADTFKRNHGIFWEPGAFQTYVNLALLFHLFLPTKKSVRLIVIFSITILTTCSTTGYIVLFLIYAAYFISSKKYSYFIEHKKVSAVIVLIIAIGTVAYLNFSYDYKNQIFGKVARYFNQDANNSSITSTSVRVDSVLKTFTQFMENPVLGSGISRTRSFAANEGYSLTTCTFVNWFAYYGLFIGLTMNYGLYRLSKFIAAGMGMRLLIFLIILLAIISEDYIRNPSILVFPMLMYNSEIRMEHSDEIKAELSDTWDK